MQSDQSHEDSSSCSLFGAVQGRAASGSAGLALSAPSCCCSSLATPQCDGEASACCVPLATSAAAAPSISSSFSASPPHASFPPTVSLTAEQETNASCSAPLLFTASALPYFTNNNSAAAQQPKQWQLQELQQQKQQQGEQPVLSVRQPLAISPRQQQQLRQQQAQHGSSHHQQPQESCQQAQQGQKQLSMQRQKVQQHSEWQRLLLWPNRQQKKQQQKFGQQLQKHVLRRAAYPPAGSAFYALLWDAKNAATQPPFSPLVADAFLPVHRASVSLFARSADPQNAAQTFPKNNSRCRGMCSTGDLNQNRPSRSNSSNVYIHPGNTRSSEENAQSWGASASETTEPAARPGAGRVDSFAGRVYRHQDAWRRARGVSGNLYIDFFRRRLLELLPHEYSLFIETCCMRSFEKSRRRALWSLHACAVSRLSIDHTRRYLLTGSLDGRISLYDLEVDFLQSFNENKGYSFQYATAAADARRHFRAPLRMLHPIRTEARKLIFRRPLVRSINAAMQSTHACAGGTGGGVWTSTAKTAVGAQEAGGGCVTSVEWMPGDNALFISASLEKTVKVWDAERWEAVYAIPLSTGIFSTAFFPLWQPSRAAHADNAVAEIAAAATTLLACGGRDGSIKICDLRVASPTMTLLGHSGAVLSLCWNPRQPSQLLSGATDKTMRAWDVRRGGEGFLWNFDRCVADPSFLAETGAASAFTDNIKGAATDLKTSCRSIAYRREAFSSSHNRPAATEATAALKTPALVSPQKVATEAFATVCEAAATTASEAAATVSEASKTVVEAAASIRTTQPRVFAADLRASTAKSTTTSKFSTTKIAPALRIGRDSITTKSAEAVAARAATRRRRPESAKNSLPRSFLNSSAEEEAAVKAEEACVDVPHADAATVVNSRAAAAGASSLQLRSAQGLPAKAPAKLATTTDSRSSSSNSSDSSKTSSGASRTSCNVSRRSSDASRNSFGPSGSTEFEAAFRSKKNGVGRRSGEDRESDEGTSVEHQQQDSSSREDFFLLQNESVRSSTSKVPGSVVKRRKVEDMKGDVKARCCISISSNKNNDSSRDPKDMEDCTDTDSSRSQFPRDSGALFSAYGRLLSRYKQQQLRETRAATRLLKQQSKQDEQQLEHQDRVQHQPKTEPLRHCSRLSNNSPKTASVSASVWRSSDGRSGHDARSSSLSAPKPFPRGSSRKSDDSGSTNIATASPSQSQSSAGALAKSSASLRKNMRSSHSFLNEENQPSAYTSFCQRQQKQQHQLQQSLSSCPRKSNRHRWGGCEAEEESPTGLTGSAAIARKTHRVERWTEEGRKSEEARFLDERAATYAKQREEEQWSAVVQRLGTRKQSRLFTSSAAVSALSSSDFFHSARAAHDGAVTAILCDGYYVISAGSDNHMRLWNADTAAHCFVYFDLEQPQQQSSRTTSNHISTATQRRRRRSSGSHTERAAVSASTRQRQSPSQQQRMRNYESTRSSTGVTRMAAASNRTDARLAYPSSSSSGSRSSGQLRQLQQACDPLCSRERWEREDAMVFGEQFCFSESQRFVLKGRGDELCAFEARTGNLQGRSAAKRALAGRQNAEKKITCTVWNEWKREAYTGRKDGKIDLWDCGDFGFLREDGVEEDEDEWLKSSSDEEEAAAEDRQRARRVIHVCAPSR